MGIGNAAPTANLHPFSGFKVFVVLKKVLDLIAAQRINVLYFLPVGVDGQNTIFRYGQQFSVLAPFIFHL